jgi:hypothetical protein
MENNKEDIGIRLQTEEKGLKENNQEDFLKKYQDLEADSQEI